MLKIAPETAVKFIAFDALKGAVARDPATATGAERFVAGGAAGAIAQVRCPPEMRAVAPRTMAILRSLDPWVTSPRPPCFRTRKGVVEADPRANSAHHSPAHSVRLHLAR